jgi:hypothetical protein
LPEIIAKRHVRAEISKTSARIRRENRAAE